MHLTAVGLNHQTASLDLRDRVAVAAEAVPDALRDLLDRVAGVTEAALLSTCNRTELYLASEASAVDPLPWFAERSGLPSGQLAAALYVHADEAAARHLMRVASGLDSMVLGEPQIFGQFKDAFALARDAGTVGPVLELSLRHAISVAKRVRTETAIGENPVSVASAAVRLAGEIFSDLGAISALLVGAGETADLLARHLAARGVRRLTVANRTLERARELASAHGGRAVPLTDLPRVLPEADVAIFSTASPLPILGKGAVESAIRRRRHRPMLIVDLAVPRDVEPEVGRLPDVYLYAVDDLRAVVEEGQRSRQEAARAAERILDEGVAQWRRQMGSLRVVGTIRTFRRTVEEIRDAELARALAALRRGVPAEEVVAQLARGLTNKLMHAPTARLRQLGEAGRDEHLRAVHELFGLDPCQRGEER
ncbi:MAG: glutamyl-tRNA reductase [Porticoccaceae bacterium]|nr:MAG: glutamyl-tRNA reductase [Porticoccaceae bacterium]